MYKILMVLTLCVRVCVWSKCAAGCETTNGVRPLTITLPSVIRRKNKILLRELIRTMWCSLSVPVTFIAGQFFFFMSLLLSGQSLYKKNNKRKPEAYFLGPLSRIYCSPAES